MPSKLPAQALLLERYDYSLITGKLCWRGSGREAGSWSWLPRRQQYELQVSVGGRMFKGARLIWRLVTGDDPGELHVDHADRNPSNNAWHNLRLATVEQSNQNQGRQRTKRSGLPRGVVHNGSSFTATIKANRQWVYLGTYRTVEEAAAARTEAALRLHGEFASFDYLPHTLT